VLNKINHTQISNTFIDEKMKGLSGSAVKVFLVIARKTIGWHKDTDYISISQIMELSGISNRVIIKAINELEENGIIRKERTKNTNKYTINYDERSQDRMTISHNQNDDKSQEPMTKGHTQKKDKETHEKKKTSANAALFNSIKNFFENNNADYYHDGKQAAMIKKIEKRGKDWDTILPLLQKFVKTIQESKDNYWAACPITPANFYSRYDGIIAYKDVKKYDGPLRLVDKQE